MIDYEEDKDGKGILNRLVLTDFGISVVTKSETLKNTLKNSITDSRGTPLHMAPEQLISQKFYPILTDIYGYGSLVVDLFFDIKIEQGKGIEEF